MQRGELLSQRHDRREKGCRKPSPNIISTLWYREVKALSSRKTSWRHVIDNQADETEASKILQQVLSTAYQMYLYKNVIGESSSAQCIHLRHAGKYKRRHADADRDKR